MAARTPIRLKRDPHNFSSVLSSAALEWLLMLLLFLDGLFSYLVTKFARFCKLQTPCLICSRLDHILGNEKPGFYRDLICISHKSEISSWAYCHVHQKLADVRDMCEGCLLSFATEKKSNTETYRSLVGKLGVDNLDDDDDHDNSFYGDDVTKIPLLNKDLVPTSPLTRHCLCCSKPFENKSHAIRLVQSKPRGVDVSSPTRQNGLDLHDGSSMTLKKSLVSTTINHSGSRGLEHRLSHVGYSELKITSDSESDVAFSDDEEGNTVVCGTGDLKEEFTDRSLQPETVTIISNSSFTALSDVQTLEKLIHPSPTLLEVSHDIPIPVEPPLSIPEKQFHEDVSHDIPIPVEPPLSIPEKQFYEDVSHDIPIPAEPPLSIPEKQFHEDVSHDIPISGHGLEELNWRQVEVRTNPPSPSEIISQQFPSEISNSKLNALESGDILCISKTSSGEVCKALSSTETNSKTGQIVNYPGPSLQVHMDLNDAYKLATSSTSSLTSPIFTEIVTRKESSRVHEDLKSLLSQISATGGLESPWNDLIPSPRVNYQSDEFKFSDASSSVILQNITKRLSIDRNESGVESLDGSIVSEIEGESVIDRMKRQVELDRKSMSLLYKELEEERSASAIAANQAMAMITRLQEEKAAMQMEALQYQRMMEDQAEYDQEALQNVNELLAQREKEIQDLEMEVDRYKKRSREGSLEDKKAGSSSDVELRDNNPTSTSLDKSGYSTESMPSNMMSLDVGLAESQLNGSLLDFEDEKLYISDCLKKLEKNLHLFPSDRENIMLEDNVRINGQYSEEAAGRNDMENHLLGDVPQEKSQTGEVLSEDSEVIGKGDRKERFVGFDSVDDRQYAMIGREKDLAAFTNKVSHLTQRLEALEVDRNFLEHTINSLRNGDKGIRFVQEIAYHLRELRRIGITPQ